MRFEKAFKVINKKHSSMEQISGIILMMFVDEKTLVSLYKIRCSIMTVFQNERKKLELQTNFDL